ncbi:MAG: hypothetical protein AAF483_19250 [Planctomycetota bacterium]
MMRFSLRTILVSTGLLALVLAIVVLQLQNMALRREVNILRIESGHLVPEDYSKVNFIQVPTADPYCWRWRVYAPPGTLFDAGIIDGEIPQEGVPSASTSGLVIPSEPNGVLITASV